MWSHYRSRKKQPPHHLSPPHLLVAIPSKLQHSRGNTWRAQICGMKLLVVPSPLLFALHPVGASHAKPSSQVCRMIFAEHHQTSHQYCTPNPAYYSLVSSDGSIRSLSVDIDELDDVAADAGVTVLPTFQVYKNGENIDSITGSDEKSLKSLITRYSWVVIQCLPGNSRTCLLAVNE